jgi:hypothetical protein
LIALFSVLVSTAAYAQTESILIFGGNNHKDFLGCLTCSELDRNSVWNDLSTHGWKNGFGTWNEFGPHKSEFSSTSACNEFASEPPGTGGPPREILRTFEHQ